MDISSTTILKDGFVFRSGTRKPRSMTPRLEHDVCDEPGKAGLSAFVKLEDALEPGGRGQKIDISKLRAPLTAFLEPDGHVGIAPARADGSIDRDLLEAWAKTRESADMHPLTANVLDAIDEPVKRPL
jgi:hypothetical protein